MSDDQSIIIGRILYEALRRSSYQMVPQVTGMRTSVADVNYGDAAILPLQTDGWERRYENLLKVPVAIDDVEFTAYSRSAQPLRFSAWGDLAGLRVGYRWQNEYVADNISRSGANKLVTVNDREELWASLLNNETDAVVLPRIAHFEYRFPQGVKRAGVIERQPVYTYVNKAYAHLAPLLEKAYQEMLADGTVSLIHNNRKLPEDKRLILHINSYNTQVEWERRQIESIHGKLGLETEPEYRSLDLNSNELHSQASFTAIISSLIRTNFMASYPDLIIASGNEALEFVLDNYYLLFPNVPVVFFGVQGLSGSILYGLEEHVTGVSETVSFYETVSEMLRLFPWTRRIFILNDHVFSRSVYMREAIQKSMEFHKWPVEFVFSGDKPLAEILEDIRRFGPETLVLIGSYLSEGGSTFYPEIQVQKLVTAASVNPVFCLLAPYIGYGTVGGRVPAPEVQSSLVASMAAGILKGTPPADIPIIFDSASLNQWQFDYGTAKKYHIDANTLPAGHIIVNRALPVWESNPLEFRLALVVALLLLLIICGFVVFSKILAKKQAAAVTASVAKSAFLANMSHEMRTPLNAIIGLSKLSLEPEKPTGEESGNFEKIYQAGVTLLKTVNDILDISKIEAGRLELIRAEYDTPSLINDAVTQNILDLAGKPIEFRLNIDENLPARLYGDELRVKQIINNLLSNAFKYTKAGTVELSLDCQREGDEVWMTICVRDSGIGIRQSDISRMFSEYVQMDMAANRQIMGTGLGLPITKRLAEMMNGSVSVESEYGQGSVFTARILQKFVSDAVIGQAVSDSLRRRQYSDQKRIQDPLLPRINLPYARVLVVDDVPPNLDVAKGMLKPYGLEIDCVTSGREAVEAVRAEKIRYQAIFMDHMMPEMDGIEATRIIREEIGGEYAQTIPIIALTANALVGNEELFLSRGFQAFLPKPIETARLDAIMRQWVWNKELEASFADRQIQVNGQMIPDARRGRDRRISDRRSELDRRAFGQGHAGLNLSRSLERFGGDEAVFLQVLRSYAGNTLPLLEAAKAVTRENLAQYAIIIHGIKGASRGICADHVGTLAELLEKEAGAGNFDFVLAHNAAFIEAVETLINWMNDLLRAKTSPKLKKDQLDQAVLDRLLAACEGYDMDGVDAAMAELERHEYENDGGLVAWLRENVEQMNVTQIQEKLQAYKVSST